MVGRNLQRFRTPVSYVCRLGKTRAETETNDRLIPIQTLQFRFKTEETHVTLRQLRNLNIREWSGGVVPLTQAGHNSRHGRTLGEGGRRVSTLNYGS